VGLEARSHECALLAFQAIYVKRKVPRHYISYLKHAGKLSKSFSETLASARIERMKASYGLGDVTSAEAKKVMVEAREFTVGIKELVFTASGSDYIKIK
jgi:uncharacterized protein (UPF0332 family)